MAFDFRGTNFPGTSENYYCDPNGIDLGAVARNRVHFPNTVYTPRFAAVQVWDYDEIDECFVVHLMFKSGVVNQVGARSEARRDYWFTNLRERFEAAFTYATYREPTQRGTMCAARACLPSPFDVRKFLAGVDPGLTIGYDLERFPGVTIRFKQRQSEQGRRSGKRGTGSVVTNAFPGSIKFVVTGALDEAGARVVADQFAAIVARAYATVDAAEANRRTDEIGDASTRATGESAQNTTNVAARSSAFARGRARRAARKRLAGNLEPQALSAVKRTRRR